MLDYKFDKSSLVNKQNTLINIHLKKIILIEHWKKYNTRIIRLWSMLLPRILLPYFLNQVHLESCMCVRVMNFFWYLKVCLIAWMMVWLTIGSEAVPSTTSQSNASLPLLRSPLTIMLWSITHALIITPISFSFIRRAGPWTKANRAYNTLKAVSYTHLTLPTNREV